MVMVLIHQVLTKVCCQPSVKEWPKCYLDLHRTYPSLKACTAVRKELYEIRICHKPTSTRQHCADALKFHIVCPPISSHNVVNLITRTPEPAKPVDDSFQHNAKSSLCSQSINGFINFLASNLLPHCFPITIQSARVTNFIIQHTRDLAIDIRVFVF